MKAAVITDEVYVEIELLRKHGMSLRKQPSQGLAWHLLGARAGHYNSQYDLGWMLFTGRGKDVEAATAKRIGIFWMRRAAEQGHHYAKRKLEENDISLSEEPDSTLSIHSVLDYLYTWVRILCRKKIKQDSLRRAYPPRTS